jgi:hypothetical protein
MARQLKPLASVLMILVKLIESEWWGFGGRKSVIPAFEDGGMLGLFVEPSTSE